MGWHVWTKTEGVRHQNSTKTCKYKSDIVLVYLLKKDHCPAKMYFVHRMHMNIRKLTLQCKMMYKIFMKKRVIVIKNQELITWYLKMTRDHSVDCIQCMLKELQAQEYNLLLKQKFNFYKTSNLFLRKHIFYKLDLKYKNLHLPFCRAADEISSVNPVRSFLNTDFIGKATVKCMWQYTILYL